MLPQQMIIGQPDCEVPEHEYEHKLESDAYVHGGANGYCVLLDQWAIVAALPFYILDQRVHVLQLSLDLARQTVELLAVVVQY